MGNFKSLADMMLQNSRAQAIFKQNMQYAKPAPTYQTNLPFYQEPQFQQWVKQNNVPWQDSPTADYDMRGFYQALVNRDPQAMTAIDPNDNLTHYPDYWKTPYHQTFSNQSQWAAPGAPVWNDRDQLVLPNGNVVFDDRNRGGQ